MGGNRLAPFRITLWTLGLVATALGFAQDATPTTVPASRQADNVAVITLRTGDTPIDSVIARSFIRRLQLAEQSGADAVVVDIDTPGGEIGAVLDISEAIKGSSIENTAAWINHKAFSGGAIIALACRDVLVSDPAQMGIALPIGVDPLGQLVELPPEERGKLMIPLIRDVIDSVRRKNRDAYVWDEFLAQGIISTGVELWWVEHTGTGQRIAINRAEYRTLFGEAPRDTPPRIGSVTVAGGVAMSDAVLPVEGEPLPGADDTAIPPAAPKLEAVAKAAAGGQQFPTRRPIITPEQQGQWRLIERISDGTAPLVLNADDLRDFNFAANESPIRSLDALEDWFGAKAVTRVDPLWSEGLVRFLTSNIVRGVLLVLFLLGLFVEMVSPGMVLPGLISMLALGALLVPPFLIGMANWWEIAAIIGGILLILAEIFVFPGFGVAGVLGVVFLFGGLFGTFIPDQRSLFADPSEQQRDLLFAAVTMILAVSTAGVGAWLISRHFGTLPLLRRLVLEEERGGDEELIRAMEPPAPELVAVGDAGAAVTPLRPSGRVQIGESIIDAVAEGGYISSGRPVRVVEVTPFRIVVAEAADKAPQRDETA